MRIHADADPQHGPWDKNINVPAVMKIDRENGYVRTSESYRRTLSGRPAGLGLGRRWPGCTVPLPAFAYNSELIVGNQSMSNYD
jgi:hypothetical protein